MATLNIFVIPQRVFKLQLTIRRTLVKRYKEYAYILLLDISVKEGVFRLTRTFCNLRRSSRIDHYTLLFRYA